MSICGTDWKKSIHRAIQNPPSGSSEQLSLKSGESRLFISASEMAQTQSHLWDPIITLAAFQPSWYYDIWIFMILLEPEKGSPWHWQPTTNVRVAIDGTSKWQKVATLVPIPHNASQRVIVSATWPAVLAECLHFVHVPFMAWQIESSCWS